MREFLASSQGVEFESRDRDELYGWVGGTLTQHGYGESGRADKGLLRGYVQNMTGLSRAPTARLIKQYAREGELRVSNYRRHTFTVRYTRADVELLAAVDQAHETLSGPATQKILQRALYDFDDRRFERLAQISVAQLYRLRGSRAYRQGRVLVQGTKPTQISIGERRAHQPQGRPGYLRVDTVHQGDLDGHRGVYHINAVDEVTQWQVVGAAAQISEAWMIPVCRFSVKSRAGALRRRV